MKARNVFLVVSCLFLLTVLGLFLWQPGRYHKYSPILPAAAQYQQYLSDWSVTDKSSFADCMMNYTEDREVTGAEVQACAQKVNSK
jgi:hypothetical protein